MGSRVSCKTLLALLLACLLLCDSAGAWTGRKHNRSNSRTNGKQHACGSTIRGKRPLPAAFSVKHKAVAPPVTVLQQATGGVIQPAVRGPHDAPPASSHPGDYHSPPKRRRQLLQDPRFNAPPPAPSTDDTNSTDDAPSQRQAHNHTQSGQPGHNHTQSGQPDTTNKCEYFDDYAHYNNYESDGQNNDYSDDHGDSDSGSSSNSTQSDGSNNTTAPADGSGSSNQSTTDSQDGGSNTTTNSSSNSNQTTTGSQDGGSNSTAPGNDSGSGGNQTTTGSPPDITPVAITAFPYRSNSFNSTSLPFSVVYAGSRSPGGVVEHCFAVMQSDDDEQADDALLAVYRNLTDPSAAQPQANVTGLELEIGSGCIAAVSVINIADQPAGSIRYDMTGGNGKLMVHLPRGAVAPGGAVQVCLFMSCSSSCPDIATLCADDDGSGGCGYAVSVLLKAPGNGSHAIMQAVGSTGPIIDASAPGTCPASNLYNSSGQAVVSDSDVVSSMPNATHGTLWLTWTAVTCPEQEFYASVQARLRNEFQTPVAFTGASCHSVGRGINLVSIDYIFGNVSGDPRGLEAWSISSQLEQITANCPCASFTGPPYCPGVTDPMPAPAAAAGSSNDSSITLPGVLYVQWNDTAPPPVEFYRAAERALSDRLNANIVLTWTSSVSGGSNGNSTGANWVNGSMLVLMGFNSTNGTTQLDASMCSDAAMSATLTATDARAVAASIFAVPVMPAAGAASLRVSAIMYVAFLRANSTCPDRPYYHMLEGILAMLWEADAATVDLAGVRCSNPPAASGVVATAAATNSRRLAQTSSSKAVVVPYTTTNARGSAPSDAAFLAALQAQDSSVSCMPASGNSTQMGTCPTTTTTTGSSSTTASPPSPSPASSTPHGSTQAGSDAPTNSMTGTTWWPTTPAGSSSAGAQGGSMQGAGDGVDARLIGIIVGACVGGIVLIAFLAATVFFIRRRRVYNSTNELAAAITAAGVGGAAPKASWGGAVAVKLDATPGVSSSGAPPSVGLPASVPAAGSSGSSGCASPSGLAWYPGGGGAIANDAGMYDEDDSRPPEQPAAASLK